MQNPSELATPAHSSSTALSASQLAQQLASGALTSRELTESLIDKINEVNPKLNAVSQPLFESARTEAAAADARLEECRRRQVAPPPGCGVPMTIKDCFDVAGAFSTLGIDRLAGSPAESDSPLVARLRASGSVVLGKTNVPQGMLLHSSDNPLYGRTLHPTHADRGPGGSSGGCASIVASGASPMSLGSDLGGSIRQPAHVCGLAGLKPTSGRLSNIGSRRGLAGMNEVAVQAGPLARCVDDVDLLMRMLTDTSVVPRQTDEQLKPWNDFRKVDVATLSVACWPTDGWFEPAPAIASAVTEAAEALRAEGAAVAEATAFRMDEAMRTYFGIVSADGLRSVARLVRGSRVEWQLRRQLLLGGLPRWLSTIPWGLLRLAGQKELARLLELTGPRSADNYWQRTAKAKEIQEQFWDRLEESACTNIDALILPPHALPALRHGTSIDLLRAASYCYLPNLLGAPAGVVPWRTIREDEQHYAPASRIDWVMRTTQATMHQSAGLPIGVQVVARPWREDIVLAVMAAIEARAPK